VIECAPTASFEVEILARPDMTEIVWMIVAPSLKVTEPVGVAPVADFIVA
jgi:hypothetical protein